MAEISDHQLQEAYRRYLGYRESEAKYQRMEIILTASVAVVLFLLVIASYLTVRANYSGEQLSSRLTREISDLTPDIKAALLEVGEEVMPVYIDMGRRKLEEALPEMEQALSKELDQLWLNAGNQIQDDFDAAFDRMAKKLESDLQAEFPGLLDPPTLALLEKELTEMLEQDTGNFIEEFFDRYSGDLKQLYTTIEGFKPNRFERLDDDQLAAHYIHLWLMLLDREIMGLE